MVKKSIGEIIQVAKDSAKAAQNNVDNLYVMIGTIPGDTPTLLSVKNNVFTIRAANVTDAKRRGQKIFDKFNKYLVQAVCKDFGYCNKKEEVKKALDKYLPDIVKAILARIPTIGKLPQWLVKLLGAFGIAAASTEVLIAMFVAWIIIEGCDELCDCKT